MQRVFLSAEWRYVAMLNYRADPETLKQYVPQGTELDYFEGETFVSLVGFRFLRTRVFGAPVPFHTNFDEVNLRIYVRREEAGELRRGVTFIREIVPRHAIATIARRAYNEPYICLPMRHAVEEDETHAAVDYRWKSRTGWNRLHARASGIPNLPENGGLEQFITEHYWGYTAQREGGSIEYEVVHPPWRIWRADHAGFEGDALGVYGETFARLLSLPPDSAFIAEGSPVTVSAGRRLR